MERCSYFIEQKALFGSFPTQDAVHLLEENGVRYFIDLTEQNEKKTMPYRTSYNYIKYPIKDRSIPRNWKTFAKLILNVCNIISDLKNNEKIYVHCRGGHGRSGLVVACLLCYYYDITPEKSLKITNECHSLRLDMKEKWRKIGAPQEFKQKEFVYKFFQPLKFNGLEKEGYTVGFHNSNNYSITIPEIGIFSNAYIALQYFKNPENPIYVKKLLEGKYECKYIKNINPKWKTEKIKYMYNVLKYKFLQHETLRKNLVYSGLRPIVKISKNLFWGKNTSGEGENILGKLLMKLRLYFLVNNI